MKKWMALFSLILVFTLAACGGESEPDNSAVIAELEAAAADIDLFDAPLTENISLPSSDGDVSITWTSSNESLLSLEGVIARPGYGEADLGVQMTGVFEKDGESLTEYFNATIAAEGEEALIALMDEAVAGLSFNVATVSEKIDLTDEVGDGTLVYTSLTPDVVTH